MFPGDYARDTGHLSMSEHGAYKLLLDHLYATEKPLPKNHEILHRICRAISQSERDIVVKIRDEFFIETPKGYTHKRFKEELKHAKSRAKIARANGRKGGRPITQRVSKTKPSGVPKQKATPDSRLQTPEESKEEAGTAAAFVAIGFDKPFGQVKFQAIWIKHFEIAIAAGEWLTQAMEDTAQECQSLNIGVPPQFFSAKREVETREMAEFERKYHRTPL